MGADHTDVFKKHKIPLEYDSFCFSIITPKRTLDLRYDDTTIIKIWVDQVQNLIVRNHENKKTPAI